MTKPVLVLGGGIAGIQSAYDLAEMGVPVYLVESKPALGGRMAQLDKTFPTNDCSTCILAPKISDCYNHELVTTYTYSELVSVDGDKGNFTVKIKQKPRYVNTEACTGCGECIEKCPVSGVADNYNQGLHTRKAIYKYQDQGVPNVVTIDPEQCLKLNEDKCGLCSRVCDKNAINYKQEVRIEDLEVASIIFAAGYEAFAGDIVSEYGYRKYDNVVTSLEYERLLSASGPTGGHIERPSDGKSAQKIAFIHCSGSRDFRTDRSYCSSVCCMYSIKQSLITEEHITDADLDLYYMDLRAFGKGFERYYNMAEDTTGINFRRSRVAELEENRENGNIMLRALNEEGEFNEEQYDLVVLAVGLKPSTQISDMMKKLKIRINRYGFADVKETEPLATSREGIFACGVITGPKDIPESVIQASGAAARAGEIAGVEPGKTEIEEEVEEVESYTFTDNAPVRIGVFVCHCGTNIAGVVDVADVKEQAAELPYVEHAEDVKYLCSSDSQELIADRIKEKNLNRIVIASCTPRTHEPLFRKAVARAGLNPYLMIMTNIRDQDSWVHREQEQQATIKAFDLVKGAVAKARKAYSLNRTRVEKLNRAAVVGGGVSGMTAAYQLAGMGFPVTLIEKEHELGGNANKLLMSMDGRPVVKFIEELKTKINTHPLIEVHKNSSIDKIEGYVGNYQLSLNANDNEENNNTKTDDIEAGIVIVATGARELETDEYLAAEDSRVISQLDLEEKLKNGGLDEDTDKIFMIQCVGSREEGREYCSRLCCTQAVNNAIYIKERNPETEITILYREMRTYGFYEDKYRQARDLGINFVRYDTDNKPQVKAKTDGLKITYREPVTDEEITERGDLLVLARAIIPETDNQSLSQQLKVPLNEDGFFLEAHVKLRPVDFATDGVYLCGLAHGPKNLGEAIAQSKAAASRAATVLAGDYLLTEAMVATVNPDLCSGCGACEDVCAYQAVTVNEETETAEVNTVL
ncbi:MAG: FAD-dependent oxidoreductase, partial [Halanaerobiales bacterium]